MTAEQVLAMFESGYGAYAAGYRMLDALISGGRRELKTLADLILRSGSAYTSDLIDDVLCHLPIEDLTELVAQVMHEHADDRGLVGQAAKVVEAAAFQHPQALTPFLPRLWATDPQNLHGYAASPWRGADAAELDRLAVAVADEADPHMKAQITMTLIDTEQQPGWQLAREHEAGIAILTPAARRDRWLTVGVDDKHRPGYRRLYTATSYHLILPDQALVSEVPPWLERRHPTWSLSGSQGRAVTGGHSDGQCNAGHGPMRRLLQLDPVPAGCGVTTRSRLDLAYCYYCDDGWQPGYFWHGDNGTPHTVEQPRVLPDILPFELEDVRANGCACPYLSPVAGPGLRFAQPRLS